MNISQRILNLSPEKRKLLELKLKRQNLPLTKASLLQLKKNRGDRYIEAAEEKEYYRLSSSQKRFYILNCFLEYILPMAFHIDGEPDRRRFERVIQALIKRHESLRTSFVLVGEEPFRRIYKYEELEFKVDYYDCGSKAGDSQPGVEAALKQVLRPFNISVPPLLRVGLIKLPGTRHLFVINTHHLVSDGVSQAILIKEFIRLYMEEELPSLRIRYRDFSEWENRWFKPGEYKKQEKYWCDLFSGDIPLLNMPTDYPRPEMQSYDGNKLHFEIKGENLECLKALAFKERASLYMVLMTVTNILLFRYSGQEDIVLGTITAGRERFELQALIGVLVNPLAARNYPAPHKTFTGFLKELKYNMLKVFENQLYPFGDLVDKVVKKKDLGRSPLFDVMFIFLNRPIEKEEAAGLQFTRSQLGQEYIAHAQQDITLYAIEEEEKIRLDLEYCTALFKQESMQRLFRHFINLLMGAAANPGLKLSEIEMMSQEEKLRLLTEFNDTRADYPHEKTIQQLFAEQVKQTPDHVALVGPQVKYRTHMTYMTYISYRELNEISRQLAHLLRKKGVKPDTIVGIMVERSIQMIVGLLGILKAGAAYMPIDPDYPRERILFMLEDSQVPILLADSGVMKKHPLKTRENSREIIFLDDTREINQPEGAWNKEKDTIPEPAASLTDLAYIIYTSGSTGKPKGTAVEQKNLLAYLNSFQKEFVVTNKDTVLQQASYGFDTFAEELYPTLLNGAKLVILDKNAVKDINALSDFILAYDVTIIDCSPLLLNELNQRRQKNSIHTYISGGDILKKEHIDNLLAKGTVYNTYGPTETTVCASYYQCPGVSDSSVSIPIGNPISNYRIYILDRHDGLLPIGIPGELCISGDGVSRGYLNNPELTAQKFCLRRPGGALFGKNRPPWTPLQKLLIKGTGKKISGKKISHLINRSYRSNMSYIFRTGDLARWLPDGNIEFLGRIDQQVKVRGYRIEAGEIQQHLVQLECINDAVLLGRNDKTGNKYLCAYIVPELKKKSHETGFITISELRAYLSARLPDYMIPDQFIEVGEIPLTVNGKIDERALLQLEESIESGTTYVKPGNEIQQQLTELWQDILMKDRIGIDDNFFDLGGQSILAIKLSARIKETFHVMIPLITIFQEGTIRRLAEALSGLKPGDSPGTPDHLIKKGLVRPFDPGHAPLVRATVVKLGDHSHFFFIDMHHIITDGISMDIITEEFTRLYQQNELNEMPIQYKEFSQWQKCFFESESFRKQESYWLDVFSGEIPRLNLPLDFPRPEKRKGQGKKIKMKVEPGLALQLKEFAAEQQVTLFMLFLAAYTILLAKTGGQDDIIVGTPVSGRIHANVRQMVGMFVNTLVMCNQPRNHLTFYEFLQRVKEQTLSALGNQDYPFEMLVERLNLAGEANRNPLFDTMFALEQYYEPFTQNINKGTDTISGDNDLLLIPYEMEQSGSMFDLALGIVVTPGDIIAAFRYDLHLFEDQTIQRMAEQFITILSWIAAAPQQRIDEIHPGILPAKPGSPMDDQEEQLLQEKPSLSPSLEELPAQESLKLTEQKREQVLSQLNEPRMEYPTDLTLHRLFESRARAIPDGTALICSRQHVTYEELNRQSHRLAHFLMEKGVNTDRIVGIMVERSVEMIIGILGILKAGGAYLPINPGLPGERIDYMLADSSAIILLTTGDDSNEIKFEKEIISDAINRVPTLSSTLTSTCRVSSTNLAYIIYTSGTTGKPKGVLISHSNVCPLLHYGFKHLGIGPGHHTVQNLSYYFDWSVWEIFITLTTGAAFHVIPGDQWLSPGDSIEFIHKHAITILHITPTQWQYFIDINRKIKPLKYLFIGAEKLSFNLVKRSIETINGDCRIFNMYGPTEAAIISSVLEIDRTCVDSLSELSGIPIGKAVGNTELFVLAENLAEEKAGELHIGGDGVSKGYLNQPELTAERFLPLFYRSYRSNKSYILYKTGDLVRCLEDGNIEFLGRKDNQVKIRGFRIELEEIETVLLKHPQILEAAVILRDEPGLTKCPAAYIVPRKNLTLAELRSYLQQKLPDYMVPSLFFKIEQMPLTPSGKLDKKSLPRLGTSIEAGSNYAAPANELERQLVQAWAEILKSSQDKISINDDFFEIGGDSLRGYLLLTKINHDFHTKIVMKDLFCAPTIRELAGILSIAGADQYSPMACVEKKEYYPVSSAQKRLYVIQGLNNEDTSYNVPMGMMFSGPLDKNRLKNIIEQLVQRHESLRTRFQVIDGEIVQKIEENPDFNVEFFEVKEQLPGITEKEREKWAKNTIEKIIKGNMPSDQMLPYREIQDNLLATIKLSGMELRAQAREEANREYEAYEASSAQKRLYLINQLVGDSTLYNMPFCWILEGNIDPSRLETAVRKMIRRQDTLRTCFAARDGKVLQKVYYHLEYHLEYREMEKDSKQDIDVIFNDFIYSFDLDQLPLWRMELVQVEKNKQLLFFDIHHIVCDGTSVDVLLHDLMTFYHGGELPGLEYQYVDFTLWQNEQWKTQRIKRQEQYWLQAFEGELPILDLPTDYPRSKETRIAGTNMEFNIGNDLTTKLNQLAARNDTTLYVVLLAVYHVLLSKYTNQEDIIVGSALSGRSHQEFNHIIGMFVNTLALRNKSVPGKTFNEFLYEVTENTFSAYENQDYPFEMLVEKVVPGRNLNRNPLFDTMLVLQNYSRMVQFASPGNKDVVLTPYCSKARAAKFDIVLEVFETEGDISILLEYRTCLFRHETIQRFRRHFINIIKQVVNDSHLKISGIQMISAAEKDHLLDVLNDTAAEYTVNQDKVLHELFEEQAEKTPDNIAIVGPSVSLEAINRSPQQITYNQLNEKANRLAWLLIKKGVKTDTIVALMLDRSLEMIIGILGILKAGGAYLPIDTDYPEKRKLSILEESGVLYLLTGENVSRSISFPWQQRITRNAVRLKPIVTAARQPIKDFDSLPFPNRTLVNYEAYHQHIGIAMARHTVSLQATRGCPYNCAYCHKIWPKKHVVRSADNIFAEMNHLHQAGVKRFVFIDDIFNLEIKNSSKLLEMLIKKMPGIQLFFPNGLRGDILTQEYIDLMIEAGTVNIDLAIESASPRIQKLIGKNLNLEKFSENVQYITQKHPQLLLEMELMIGFPTETEEEALMTLDYLKSLKWVHFPNLNILKIYPNTDMCRLALENGVSMESIESSVNLAYHELPDTLPFSRNFTRLYQARFMNEYMLSKERLLHVLPHQVKILGQEEMVQKYDSYFPREIKDFPGILQLGGISQEEFGNVQWLKDENIAVPRFQQEINQSFSTGSRVQNQDALRILLLDLSQFFTRDSRDMLYDMVEEPLGLMYLLTYLNRQLGNRIQGKIAKSRIDFDCFEELEQLLRDFKPDVIGIRTLSYYKEFFHKTVSLVRSWGIEVPIIAGGPYASSDYRQLLQDRHVDLAVLGEGEQTLTQLIEKMIANSNRLPHENQLQNIPGIAFIKEKDKNRLKQRKRDIVLLDQVSGTLEKQTGENPQKINKPGDLLYLISTSGSTGKPKIVMLEHGNLRNLLEFQFSHLDIDFTRVLQFASLGFDASAHEIFSALLSGGGLFLITREIKYDITRLLDYIRENFVNILFLPPAFLKYAFGDHEYAAAFPTCVKHIIAAGEQLVVPVRFQKYLQANHVFLHNDYGPAETHVVTTLTLDPANEIPELPGIGKPIINTKILIMDRAMNLQPIGVVGELYIGGISVGRGYLNNPGLTARKFQILDPERYYRSYRSYKSYITYQTGDLARWRWDENIEFLGRIDHQVKIRGFRIELEEIQNQLCSHENIKEAVVLAKENNNRDKYICAYIVLNVPPVNSGSANGLNITDLRTYLSRQLPDYMIPSYFIPVEKIPLNSSGKVDRKRLPEPGLTPGRSYAAPRSEKEKKLVKVWAEVIGRNALPGSQKEIGIEDNFFQLGGHSLSAILMVSKIHKEFGVKITLEDIFKNQTVKQLAASLEQEKKGKYTALEPVEKREYYALSSVQKRIYFIQQLDLNNVTYNLPQVFHLGKDIETDKLELALKKLVQRHESLRTSFHIVHKEPVQMVHEQVELELEYYDVSQDVVKVESEFIRAFDLSQAPLIRSGLIRHPDGHHAWMVDIHHIVSDGTSQTILTEDFIALYNEEELEPLKLQYKDFAQWQNFLFESGAIQTQENYWLNRCRDAEEIPRLDMFTDFKRPEVFTFAGDVYSFALEQEDAAKFKQLSLRGGGTLYMNFLAAINTLFYKYTGQTDIIIGSSIAGRSHYDPREIVGMFVNILVMRNYPRGEKTYESFLQEVIAGSVKAFENQDVQFEELVDKLEVQRDPSRNPLFDIALVMQNLRKPQLSITSNEVFPVRAMETGFGNPTSRFDMNFFVREDREDVTIHIEYYTALFKPGTIKRLEMHLKNIIKTVIKEPNIKLKDIEIITSEEKKQILHEFNDTARDYPRDKSIPQLFAKQVERIPDRIAIIGAGTRFITSASMKRPIHLTYRELNNKVNQLAHYLYLEKKIRPDQPVGILMNRSIDLITAILGILKAGGAYVPIAPDLPEERVKIIINDAQIKIVISQERYLGMLNRLQCECEYFRYDLTGFHNYHTGCLSGKKFHLQDLAYLIYTSGTSGKPKGVMIQHQSLVNYVLWGIRQYIPGTETNNHQYYFPFYTSISFDLTVTSIFLPLISGNTIVVVSEDSTQPSLPILEVVETGIEADIIKTTPSHLKLVRNGIVNKTLKPGIKKFIVGGEAFDTPLANDIYQSLPGDIDIYNEYGPTEATVGCMIYRYDNEHDRRQVVPIGKPADNVKIYIYDSYMKPVPYGVVGEMYIGGIALARGYVNQPELTAERFLLVSNRSYMSYMSYIIYQTGDLARMLPNGNIEFIGRKDQQVKIRGYRIEIQEIENRILEHQDIKDAVVLSGSRKNHDDYLCCYWTAVDGISLESADLREYLSKGLPEYMIPSYFVQLEKIPLTANGKVDRKALPEPGFTPGENYMPPRNEIEKKLVEIWQEVLGFGSDSLPTSIGIKDNFFQLGGHSLKAITLVSSIHSEFNLQVPLVEIFKTPFIKELASYIMDSAEIETVPGDSQLMLLKKGTHPARNLFLVHDGTGEIDGYTEFALRLPGQFNCWGLRADRFDTVGPQNLKIEVTAKKYLEKIKTIQPDGPYYIAGWCVGGLIAYEIVKQLEDRKDTVDFLGIINSYVPSPEVPAKAKEFTVESELNWVPTYLTGIENHIMPTNRKGLNTLWSEIIKYLEKQRYPIQRIKNLVPVHLESVIPNYHQMGIAELIYYINIRRSFLKAQEFYLPVGKITAPVYFFGASDEEISNKENWNDFTSLPVKFYEITGDHYSIFRVPQVIKFAGTFGKVIHSRNWSINP